MTAINCPVCQAGFKEVIRDGILIDICTQCKGVWLDRGELDKLLEAVRGDSVAYEIKRATGDRNKHDYRDSRRVSYDDDDDYDRKNYGHAGYRKKSKLESLFDVFD